ncbi:MAG TPA: hypothetical protein VFG87_21800 [Amycolatopsis sp.]|nr:hypothetical protein [Amycolatopsis sp.]
MMKMVCRVATVAGAATAALTVLLAAPASADPMHPAVFPQPPVSAQDQYFPMGQHCDGRSFRAGPDTSYDFHADVILRGGHPGKWFIASRLVRPGARPELWNAYAVC